MVDNIKAKESPWIFRTYAGHSTPGKSNELFKRNLAKGQTGLSVAFDLPTQLGYDCNHPLARGEVGKVGVSISSIEDMAVLLDGIPLDRMNISMTINATAPWLLALLVALADKQGVKRSVLQGTTQNDVLKEFLSRGTYIFPPQISLELMRDVILFTVEEIPKWNHINICSYHLKEAGATPVQELAFALANATAVLDALVEKGLSGEKLGAVCARLSFFVNAGMRFITEICKLRAFGELWDKLLQERYNIQKAEQRRFRYGVQVNSLGLTESQPENNILRIVYELLGVTLSRKSRARAIQLPAWNEALGLPRPFDQQWSLRAQQILAFETDLLEFGDIFDDNKEIAKLVEKIKLESLELLQTISAMGGAINAFSYMKGAMVAANTARLQAIEDNQQIIVGVNQYKESEKSPLEDDELIYVVGNEIEDERCRDLQKFLSKRDKKAVERTLNNLRQAALEKKSIMEASIEAAKAGVTTGEWAQTLRGIYGEGLALIGISGVKQGDSQEIKAIREEVDQLSKSLGRRVKILIGKPGLDGHSNGAEQIAVRARDCGMEVVYQGIRRTPSELAAAALEEGVHCIGLSILSGSHLGLTKELMSELKTVGMNQIPVIVGGIIPAADIPVLKKMGISAVFTPKYYSLNNIMHSIVTIIVDQHQKHNFK